MENKIELTEYQKKLLETIKNTENYNYILVTQCYGLGKTNSTMIEILNKATSIIQCD